MLRLNGGCRIDPFLKQGKLCLRISAPRTLMMKEAVPWRNIWSSAC